MIVPIYVAEVAVWSARREEYTSTHELESFDPIPLEFIERECGSRVEITRGLEPRFWVRTPPLARLVETPCRVVNMPGLPAIGTSKAILLSGEKCTGKCAWVVLGIAKGGQGDFQIVPGPVLETSRDVLDQMAQELPPLIVPENRVERETPQVALARKPRKAKPSLQPMLWGDE